MQTTAGPRPFADVYRAGTKPGRHTPRYGQALVEQAIILGVGTAYYWIAPELNKTDWDFPDYATRMSNFKPTFDTNLYFTNHILHPFAGSLYYGFSRLNGLSVPASAAYAVGSAALFEFFLEWLEKASINDMIFTPMGGLPAGEFFLHVGDYFRSAPGGGRWYHRASGAVAGLPHAAHQLVHPEPRIDPVYQMPPDSLGFSSYYWHRFDGTLGASWASNDAHSSGAQRELMVRAEIIAIPGFLRPGRFRLDFDDGDFTEARLKVISGDAGTPSVDLWFDANLIGSYQQDISPERVGVATMVAVNSSMRFVNRHVLGRHDQFALAQLFGPALKVWATHGGVVARFDAAVHPDFAAIRSLAYTGWVERYGAEGTRSVLQEQGYDFAFGGSARARGVIEAGGFEAGSRVFLGGYGSIDQGDRFAERVTRNVHGQERIFEVEGWLGWSPPPLPIQASIFAERLGRASDMEPVSVRRWDNRWGLRLGLKL